MGTFLKNGTFLIWETIGVPQVIGILHGNSENYRNSLSPIFEKNFVKVTILLNKLLKSWFDEIFLKWQRISRFSTLRNLQSASVEISDIYGKKFRESNGFTK